MNMLRKKIGYLTYIQDLLLSHVYIIIIVKQNMQVQTNVILHAFYLSPDLSGFKKSNKY